MVVLCLLLLAPKTEEKESENLDLLINVTEKQNADDKENSLKGFL